MNKIKKQDIINQSKESQSRLSDIIKKYPYEKKGVFNSELLLFISVFELSNSNKIIESGRARGHSTKILCEYFSNTDIDIISIEKRRGGEDDKIACKKLVGYDNLDMKYGDSRKIIGDEVSQSTCVMIDGPKGDTAIKIALNLLKMQGTQAVFVHDLHRNTLHRDLTELLFNDTYFSDNQEFVNTFKHLDDPCWEYLDSAEWGPYLRKGDEIESYASTLGAFFNSENPIDTLREENY
jgi:hypothetical protein